MDGYLLFYTYISKWKLERAKGNFDESFVSTEDTLSKPGYSLEEYTSTYSGYDYETVLEVTNDGHLTYNRYCADLNQLKQEFERLKALPPSERWAEALEIAKEWAGAKIANLTGRNVPKSREEAESTLRQFLAEKAHEVNEDTVRRVSNMLFALDRDSCENYPFSRSIQFYEDWHYLDYTDFTWSGIHDSVGVIAFVFKSRLASTGYG